MVHVSELASPSLVQVPSGRIIPGKHTVAS